MRISRRELLGGSVATLASSSLASSPETAPQPAKLTDRGKPEVYSGQDLAYIGMPVGGLFAGNLYLGGDGQLWNWDIFNESRFGAIVQEVVYMGDRIHAGGGANYVAPVRQTSPFRQEFSLWLEGKSPRKVKFGHVEFRGEYPVGKVKYTQADADVEMSLVAFSPFCPLEVESSSFPATTMTFRVKNTGSARASYRLTYALENPVLCVSRKTRAVQTTARKTAFGGLAFMPEEPKAVTARSEILFEDWSSGSYGAWVTSGTAFGDSPQRVDKLPSYMGPVKAGGKFVVNTHQTRGGEDVTVADQHKGTLTSPTFQIQRNFINLRVGGGAHKGRTCVNLVVEGKVVRSVTGRDSNVMRWESWEVTEFVGRAAKIVVVDDESGGWGQISLGEVIFADTSRAGGDLKDLGDYGTFCVEVIGGADSAVGGESTVSRKLDLKPGEEVEVTFVVAWHFPNCRGDLPQSKHWYGVRWANAEAVAGEIIKRWPELRKKTLDWNATWYDSTLPHWFLDRTFANTSTLATTTCYRFADGRFYFWEGVGCCAGTCTHVWGYAQAIGRIFPEVERYLRTDIDFGRAFRPDTGAIDYRAEYHQTVAVDGQCGCILRAYREHQMSRSSTYLKSIWPKVKKATEYLIAMDEGKDGILNGAQYNTLDTAWYGKIAWISSLYLAAVKAASAMAQEMGDTAFVRLCAGILEKGSQNMVKELFNGEYFIHKTDPAHPESNNTNDGCHIDQLYGQFWAHQVGLGRIVPQKETLAALKSLYKYSFFEDIWEYRRKYQGIPGGRWYAVPGEAGLIMCSFPKGGAAKSVGQGNDAWATMYFNECMSGFEHQVAAHMISEGMVNEGMRLVKAIHDRYSATKRNPYNEVECSDHYGRALASYGAYVAMTGFVNDGPHGRMTHDPKVKGRFRCAFINERGWGTYERSANGKETVAYRHELK